MSRLAIIGTLAIVTSLHPVSAQVTPYKLGTFMEGARTFIGLVLNDTLVIDLAALNQAYEKQNPAAARIAVPGDMRQLIAGYESAGLKARLATLAAAAGATRPAASFEIAKVKTLPPVMPQTILNAAANYVEHANEMAAKGALSAPAGAKTPDSIPAIWMRRPGDTRQNPYVFPKAVGAVIASGEAIQLPPGRSQIDYECELTVVIGRPADHVPVDRAGDYIFGYMLQNDVSDRGGRGDGRHGSDWFLGKSHATFAPLGPFIVPKEFVPDPMKMPIRFTLSGKLLQDSNTDRMTHNVYEMVSYVTHILRLQPGDAIGTGSPAGVGTARAEPVYLKAGDVSSCTIGNIGTLTNPVVAAPAPTSRY